VAPGRERERERELVGLARRLKRGGEDKDHHLLLVFLVGDPRTSAETPGLCRPPTGMS